MRAALVRDAMNMAMAQRLYPESLLFPSDRGSQYASDEFRNLLGDHGLTASMSNVGDFYDDAIVEAMWSNLKKALIFHRQFARLKARGWPSSNTSKRSTIESESTTRRVTYRRWSLRQRLPHIRRQPHVRSGSILRGLYHPQRSCRGKRIVDRARRSGFVRGGEVDVRPAIDGFHPGFIANEIDIRSRGLQNRNAGRTDGSQGFGHHRRVDRCTRERLGGTTDSRSSS